MSCSLSKAHRSWTGKILILKGISPWDRDGGSFRLPNGPAPTTTNLAAAPCARPSSRGGSRADLAAMVRHGAGRCRLPGAGHGGRGAGPGHGELVAAQHASRASWEIVRGSHRACVPQLLAPAFQAPMCVIIAPQPSHSPCLHLRLRLRVCAPPTVMHRHWPGPTTGSARHPRARTPLAPPRLRPFFNRCRFLPAPYREKAIYIPVANPLHLCLLFSSPNKASALCHQLQRPPYTRSSYPLAFSCTSPSSSCSSPPSCATTLPVPPCACPR